LVKSRVSSAIQASWSISPYRSGDSRANSQEFLEIRASVLSLLDVDYMVPIDELRGEAKRIVSDSALWDKRVFGAQVTDWKTDSI
jgi:hypothetical protein